MNVCSGVQIVYHIIYMEWGDSLWSLISVQFTVGNELYIYLETLRIYWNTIVYYILKFVLLQVVWQKLEYIYIVPITRQKFIWVR